MSQDDPRARAEDLYQQYLGTFVLGEPRRDVEKRVDRAIDHSMASLNLATRLIGRPLMKSVALIPEQIDFTRSDGDAVIVFSRKLHLSAPLNGPARHQKVVTGAWANVEHRLREGAIETCISSEAGTVVNRYELSGDELLGRVHMESPHLPLPIDYVARLSRRR